MSQKIHLNIYIFKSICTLNNTVLVLTLILIINNYTEKRGNMSKKIYSHDIPDPPTNSGTF